MGVTSLTLVFAADAVTVLSLVFGVIGVVLGAVGVWAQKARAVKEPGNDDPDIGPRIR